MAKILRRSLTDCLNNHLSMNIAPTGATDCYYTAAEARNLAEKYQPQGSIISERCLTN
ncbi:MAG TPA: hypothetical protein VFV58_36305 [Blastocatellia bacterium]|jgi:hypothetical protein|nr:hypothetical protein [Blastocatellia bacterium]